MTAQGRWTVHTDRGDELSCRYYVLAVGILNLMKLPAIPGMDGFAGRAFHTARWDYGYTGGGPGEALTSLGDKAVALIGTGASGLQALPPLAESAKHVYVFQRTPSAIGVRGNRPTDPSFAEGLEPGWQKARMDNFQSIMLGRKVDADLTDDGWTHHYAAVQNPPRLKGMSVEEFMQDRRGARLRDHGGASARIDALVTDPDVAAALKPYYRYLCKRPCFHDEYFDAFNRPNVTLVDCPAGIERITERGPVVDGQQYDVDCIVYGTGFEAEVTPLQRRVGHDIVGRGGISLAEKWADGAASLFGMMSRGFPNMFVMPAPGQQSVVTVNYTQLAVLGAEFVAGAVALLEKQGVPGVRRERRGRGRLDPADRRYLRRPQRRHVGVHAVATQQRGRPGRHQGAEHQLRSRIRRLLRLPRPARKLARLRRTRRTGAGVSDRQRVVVVTGGGGGIGAAIAESIGRTGAFVVTVDPLVSVDGSERLPQPEETTAGRIVAAGGAARASAVSVTDEPGVRRLFQELADEFGGLDAVVNVAGISRPTSFAKGSDDDWLSVLVGAPRRLPQRARRCPAVDGGGGTGSHPRRHLRIGVAVGRRRRLRMRQARRGRTHLAAGSACARWRGASTPSRRSPPPAWWPPRWAATADRVARPPADWHWARCPHPNTSGRSVPTWSTRPSLRATGGCSSPAGPRSR